MRSRFREPYHFFPGGREHFEFVDEAPGSEDSDAHSRLRGVISREYLLERDDSLSLVTDDHLEHTLGFRNHPEFGFSPAAVFKGVPRDLRYRRGDAHLILVFHAEKDRDFFRATARKNHVHLVAHAMQKDPLSHRYSTSRCCFRTTQVASSRPR